MTDDAIIDVDRGTVARGVRDGTVLLVDVREAHEFVAARVPGSINRPLSRLDLADLPGDGRRVVLSCAVGVRSARALLAARAAGLPLREHYAGGLRDWAMAGEPVETGEAVDAGEPVDAGGPG